MTWLKFLFFLKGRQILSNFTSIIKKSQEVMKITVKADWWKIRRDLDAEMEVPQKLKHFGHRKNCHYYHKTWRMWFCHRIMYQKNADGMANSVDLDHTAFSGTVWSRSTLFSKACLSENSGSLWYEPVAIYSTVKSLNIRTSYIITVIVLKFE